MLFDLRSRGRRRTVQVIYLFLALVMVGGLVLVGVGTGNGNGGLLNAFTNNGSSGGAAATNSAIKTALKATTKDPTSANAWGQLVTARWEYAGQGSNYDSTSSTYTASGKKQLSALATDYQKYLTLVKTPNVEVAKLAAEAYVVLAQWTKASTAWEAVADAEPSAGSFTCLALTSYAGKDTRKGALAAATAVAKTPKLQRLEVKNELASATTAATAAEGAQSDC
jgi:hypothetical protein